MSITPTPPTLPPEPRPRPRQRPAGAATLRPRAALAVLALALALPLRVTGAQTGPPASDDPVALVVRVQGEVRVERRGASAPRRPVGGAAGRG